MSTATDALKAEANDNEDMVSFQYKGDTYTIPSPDNWSLDVIEAYEDNKIVRAVRNILGDKQYAQFKKHNPTSKDLQDLTQVMMEVVGVDAGE